MLTKWNHPRGLWSFPLRQHGGHGNLPSCQTTHQNLTNKSLMKISSEGLDIVTKCFHLPKTTGSGIKPGLWEENLHTIELRWVQTLACPSSLLGALPHCHTKALDLYTSASKRPVKKTMTLKNNDRNTWQVIFFIFY